MSFSQKAKDTDSLSSFHRALMLASSATDAEESFHMRQTKISANSHGIDSLGRAMIDATSASGLLSLYDATARIQTRQTDASALLRQQTQRIKCTARACLTASIAIIIAVGGSKV